MFTRLTNANLVQLLSQLGFKPGEANIRNRRSWQHPESGCQLSLPIDKTDEAPRPADVVGIRAQLAMQGHLEEDEFDFFAAEGELPPAAPD